MSHLPVLLDEVLDALIPENPENTRMIDGTLGAGGHTKALLERNVAQVMGFDLDSQAIALAQDHLKNYSSRVHIVQDSYANMQHHAENMGWDDVDGILLDLGISSMQIDTPERGFSFRYDAPLDMRFTSHDSRPTAANIINAWSEQALSDIFFRYGEERHARKLARAIVQERPFTRTLALAACIERVMPQPKKRPKKQIHPATRIFQALRIAVNDELQVIDRALPIAIHLLKPGGRLAVISFHSLEDRIVKRVFKAASTEIVSPPGMASIEARAATVKRINRKPMVATDSEIEQNPRSRSAKLRVVEKL